MTQDELRYGPVGLKSVRTDAAFAAAPAFLLGKVALRSPRYPGTLGGERGIILGAAGGVQMDRVRVRALAELVERASAWASGLRPGARARASTAALVREGGLVVRPETLRHDAPCPEGPGLGRVDPDAPLDWTQGVRIDTGEPARVPALAAYLNFRAPDAEVFFRPSASGLAAHRTRDAALLHGLFEVVERDACMLSWRVPGWPVRALARTTSPELEVVHALGLVAEVFEVGEPSGPAVVLALVSRGDGAELTCGSACRSSVADASAAALNEALMLQWTARVQSAGVRAKEVPETSLGHVLLAYRQGAAVLAWYRRQAARGDHERKPAWGDSARSLSAWAERTYGGVAVAVDVTDEAARASGWCVVRAVVPHASTRETDARAPHTAGDRFARARQAHAAGESTHEAPHPFG